MADQDADPMDTSEPQETPTPSTRSSSRAAPTSKIRKTSSVWGAFRQLTETVLGNFFDFSDEKEEERKEAATQRVTPPPPSPRPAPTTITQPTPPSFLQQQQPAEPEQIQGEEGENLGSRRKRKAEGSSIESGINVIKDRNERNVRYARSSDDQVLLLLNFLLSFLPYQVNEDYARARRNPPNVTDATSNVKHETYIDARNRPHNDYYLLQHLTDKPGCVAPFVLVGYNIASSSALDQFNATYSYKNHYGLFNTQAIFECSNVYGDISQTTQPDGTVVTDIPATMISMTPWQLHGFSAQFGSDIMTGHLTLGKPYPNENRDAVAPLVNYPSFFKVEPLNPTIFGNSKNIEQYKTDLELFGTGAVLPDQGSPFGSSVLNLPPRDIWKKLSLDASIQPMFDMTKPTGGTATNYTTNIINLLKSPQTRQFFFQVGSTALLETYHSSPGVLETELALLVARSLHYAKPLRWKRSPANDVIYTERQDFHVINDRRRGQRKLESLSSDFGGALEQSEVYETLLLSNTFTADPLKRSYLNFRDSPIFNVPHLIRAPLTADPAFRNLKKRTQCLLYFPQGSINMMVTTATLNGERRLHDLNSPTTPILTQEELKKGVGEWQIRQLFAGLLEIEQLLFSDETGKDEDGIITYITQMILVPETSKDDRAAYRQLMQTIRHRLRWYVVVDSQCENELRSGIIKQKHLLNHPMDFMGTEDRTVAKARRAYSLSTTGEAAFKQATPVTIYGIGLAIDVGEFDELFATRNEIGKKGIVSYMSSLDRVFHSPAFSRLSTWSAYDSEGKITSLAWKPKELPSAQAAVMPSPPSAPSNEQVMADRLASVSATTVTQPPQASRRSANLVAAPLDIVDRPAPRPPQTIPPPAAPANPLPSVAAQPTTTQQVPPQHQKSPEIIATERGELEMRVRAEMVRSIIQNHQSQEVAIREPAKAYYDVASNVLSAQNAREIERLTAQLQELETSLASIHHNNGE